MLTLYYKTGFENEDTLYLASGRVGAAAGRSVVSLADKKISPITTDRANHQDWLRLTDEIRTHFKGSLEIKI